MIHKWWAAANCKSGSVKITDRTGWFSFGSVSTNCCTVIVGPFLLINTVPRKFKLARFTFFAQPFFVLPLRNVLRNVAWRHKERLWSGLHWSDVTLLLHAKARFSWNLCVTTFLASKLFSYICKKEYMIMQLARLWVFWYRLLKLNCLIGSKWNKQTQENKLYHLYIRLYSSPLGHAIWVIFFVKIYQNLNAEVYNLLTHNFIGSIYISLYRKFCYFLLNMLFFVLLCVGDLSYPEDTRSAERTLLRWIAI